MVSNLAQTLKKYCSGSERWGIGPKTIWGHEFDTQRKWNMFMDSVRPFLLAPSPVNSCQLDIQCWPLLAGCWVGSRGGRWPSTPGSGTRSRWLWNTSRWRQWQPPEAPCSLCRWVTWPGGQGHHTPSQGHASLSPPHTTMSRSLITSQIISIIKSLPPHFIVYILIVSQ